MSKPGSSSGVLMPGPGAIKSQFILPILTSQQYELVIKAKKYCSEETARFIHSNKPSQLPTITQPPPQNRASQRHQAIQFMSRVYVGSISFEVREDMLKAAFTKYGQVKSVNMSWDMNTMKHKGFAFVEFEHPEAAGLAIERMNGIKLGNRQIKVGRPSNMPQATSILEEIDRECENGNRIYISNIHPEFDEYDLMSLMEPFGDIESCKIQSDELLRISYGYIQFKDKAMANEALTADKLDLAGYILNICKAITVVSEPASVSGDSTSSNNKTENDITNKIKNNNNNEHNNINNISENNDDKSSGNNDHDDNLGSDDNMEYGTHEISNS